MGVNLGRRGALAGAAALLVAGCGDMAPDGATEALAKQAYQNLVRKDYVALDAMMVPAVRNPANVKTYDLMRSLIPAGEPTSVARTNWQSYAGTEGRRVTYQHTYAYPGGAVMATTVLVSAIGGKTWQIYSFNINVSAAPAKPA